MAAITAPLLPSAAPEPPAPPVPPCTRSYKRVASLLLIPLLAALGLAALALRGVRPGAEHGSLPARQPLELAGWGDPRCYKVTGGTCRVLDCWSQRKAVCTWGQCICQTGCVGADGNCHSSRARLVASGFRLRNVKFSGQYLMTPRVFWEVQLRVTVNKGLFPDKWDLYELPGRAYTDNASTFYFLSPTDFPEYVVGISKAGSDDVYIAEVMHLTSRPLLDDLYPINPNVAMTTLCRPERHPGALQINSMAGEVALYVHHLSWEVFGWVDGDPGDGGYWTPELPLDLSLPKC